MRITLNRKGTIEYLESVLTIENASTERKDMIDILRFIDGEGGVVKKESLQEIIGSDISPVVIEGIINFLINIGLINHNYTLTPKSRQILKSGLFPVEERGLFRLWFVKDPLLSNYLLHYERAKFQQISTVLTLDDYGNYINNYFSSVLEDSESLFRIKKFDNEDLPRVSYFSEMGDYQLDWTIDLEREDQSELIISGVIRDNKSKRIFSNKPVSTSHGEDYKNFLVQIINQSKNEHMNWNSTLDCLEVPFGVLRIKDYIDMSTSLNVPAFESKEYGAFDQTEIVNIPIRPINQQEAKKWLIELVKSYASEKYVTKQELRLYLISLLESKTFKGFADAAKELDINTLLEEFKVGKKRDAYWNLVTPMDLFIDLDERYVVQNRRKDIKLGNRLSMREFVNMIVDNDQPEVLVYSSKYVLNTPQIKKFELFSEAFRERGVKQVLLITSDLVQTNPLIRVETYDNVYSGHRFPHDRYFAYRASGKWNLFKMSAELDQCRYVNYRDVTIDTVAGWYDISFMQVTENAFPEKLLEKLSSFEEVYSW